MSAGRERVVRANEPIRFADWPARMVFTIDPNPPRPRLVPKRDALPGAAIVIDPHRPFLFDRRRWRRHANTLLLVPAGVDGAPPFDGVALRAWRLERGFSQGEMAGMIGVHRMTVTAWEANRQMPPLMLPLALAALDAGLVPAEPIP